MRGEKKKIAILGNSHSIAIASAVSAMDRDHSHITCFDAFHTWNEEPRSGAERPAVVVHPLFEKADYSIDLDDFDLFVVCSGGWWAGRNQHLLGNGPEHPLAHVACQRWMPTTASTPVLPLVSQAVFDELVYCWIREHRITSLARFISSKNGKRALWLPWPAPSRSLKGSADWTLNSWYGQNGPTAWLDFFRAQFKALQRLSSDIGENIRLLPYPLPDIEQDGFMAASLCDDDPFHGNPSYGSLIVAQIEAHVG